MRRPSWRLLLPSALILSCGPPLTAPGGRLVHDGLGREVRVVPNPRRLVSLAPSVTETIVALGLADRLVGVSDFCTLPPSASGVRRIGGLLTPDLETIRTLHPDLLVGTTSGNDPGLDAQARALGLPLYTLQARTVDEVLTGIEGLAAALGEPARGADLAGRLRGRLAEVERRVSGEARPRVLFLIWGEPLVVPGAGAFLSDAIRRAGGASVSGELPGAHLTWSAESAIDSKPEIILTPRDNSTLPDRLLTDPAWAASDAVRRRRVYLVGDAIVRPGPGVVDGIEEMARRLHPARFEEGAPGP